MSDLVRNPEDRFSLDGAHKIGQVKQLYIYLRLSDSSLESLHRPSLFYHTNQLETATGKHIGKSYEILSLRVYKASISAYTWVRLNPDSLFFM